MSEIVLSKNEYTGSDFVSVRQSIVIKGEKSNILSVRLYNGTEMIVNAVSLRLEYFDRAGGTAYESAEIAVEGLAGLPYTEFILPDIAVPETRGAVNVKLYSVISGNCLYRINADGSIDSEICSSKTGAEGGGDSSVKRVKSKYNTIYALFLIALTAIAFAVAMLGIFKFYELPTADAADMIGEEYVETR